MGASTSLAEGFPRGFRGAAGVGANGVFALTGAADDNVDVDTGGVFGLARSFQRRRRFHFRTVVEIVGAGDERIDVEFLRCQVEACENIETNKVEKNHISSAT